MKLSGEFMLVLSLQCPEGLPFGWVAFCLSYSFADCTFLGAPDSSGGPVRWSLQPGAVGSSVQSGVQPSACMCGQEGGSQQH